MGRAKGSGLKRGVVYLHYGGGGANLLFRVAEDGGYRYDNSGMVVLHHSGNRLETDCGDGVINEHHLPETVVAPKRAVKYLDSCIASGRASDRYSWWDSNDDFKSGR